MYVIYWPLANASECYVFNHVEGTNGHYNNWSPSFCAWIVPGTIDPLAD